MSGSSSEDEISDSNIFQTARKLRKRPEPPQDAPQESVISDFPPSQPNPPITESDSKSRKVESSPQEPAQSSMSPQRRSIFDSPNFCNGDPEELAKQATLLDETGLPLRNPNEPLITDLIMGKQGNGPSEETKKLSEEPVQKFSLREMLEGKSANVPVEVLTFLLSPDVPPPELPEEGLEVDGDVSRVEQAIIDVLKPTLMKMYLKMSDEYQLLKDLEAWKPGQRSQLEEIYLKFKVVLEKSIKRAEISRQKLKLALLRDTRIHLLQLFNDLKHEQSQAEARDRIFAQLSEQLKEAQAMVNSYKQSNSEVHSVEEENEQLTAQILKLRAKLSNENVLDDKQLEQIEAAVFERVNKAEAAPNAESKLAKKELRRAIEELESQYDVEIDFDPEGAMITMSFLTIDIDLETGLWKSEFRMPPLSTEALKHYNYFINDSHFTIRKSIALWQRALEIYKIMISMFRYGYFSLTQLDPERHILRMRFHSLETNFKMVILGNTLSLEGLSDNVTNAEIEKLKALANDS